MDFDGIINASGQAYNFSISGLGTPPADKETLIHIVQASVDKNISQLTTEHGSLSQAQIESQMPNWIKDALKTNHVSSSFNVNISPVNQER